MIVEAYNLSDGVTVQGSDWDIHIATVRVQLGIVEV